MRAVTFDLWDTIVDDDTDEPIRAERGLLPKPKERRTLFVNEVLEHHSFDLDRVNEAFDHLNDRFRHWWKVEHHTPIIGDRLREGYRFLGIDETPGFAEMVEAFSMMEVDIPPVLAPGIRGCLENLHGRYKLGIVSDAIVTPGSYLRKILENYDLLHLFDYCVFSDEAGAAKPAGKVFDIACAKLNVTRENLVHIGDREANDIDGPANYGAHSVLYVGVVDRGSIATTRADAVCYHHDDMPGLIDGIFAK
jgi:FMN phosphatase YigB (HAD superfamily)